MSALSIVTHLHLHDCTATVWRWGLDGHMMAFISDTGAICSDTFPLPTVIHLIIKSVITAFVLVEDSHCKPVWVPVLVIGHREHDSYYLSVLLLGGTEHLIGENTNGSICCVRGLGERADVSFWGSHSRLQGSYVHVHVDPNDKKKITRLLQKNLRAWRQRGLLYFGCKINKWRMVKWECFMKLNLPTT